MHVITGLNTGGAEKMLMKLVSRLPGTHVVVQLGAAGRVKEEIEDLGIKVIDLGLQAEPRESTSDAFPRKGGIRGISGAARRICSSSLALVRLAKVVRQWEPDLIQGWMYHANLVALFSAWGSLRKTPVLWNIRQSFLDFSKEKGHTAAAIKISALLSSRPEAIIYNSRVSIGQHAAIGFSQQRHIYIPNGFNFDLFSPNPSQRIKSRHTLGISEGSFVVGMFARFHPMKDHQTFLRAASLLVGKVGEIEIVLAGRDVDHFNLELLAMIRTLGLEGRVKLLGELSDVSRVIHAVDVVTLSSAWGEAFPNVLGEAMASGIPVVTTDIGDCKEIVGRHGFVVRSRDPYALLAAWIELHAIGRQGRLDLGAKARESAKSRFDLTQIANIYMDLYSQCINPEPTNSPR